MEECISISLSQRRSCRPWESTWPWMGAWARLTSFLGILSLAIREASVVPGRYNWYFQKLVVLNHRVAGLHLVNDSVRSLQVMLSSPSAPTQRRLKKLLHQLFSHHLRIRQSFENQLGFNPLLPDCVQEWCVCPCQGMAKCCLYPWSISCSSAHESLFSGVV